MLSPKKAKILADCMPTATLLKICNFFKAYSLLKGFVATICTLDAYSNTFEKKMLNFFNPKHLVYKTAAPFSLDSYSNS